MTTKIVINSFRTRGLHGVLTQETEVGNEFVFDITVEADFNQACESDKLTTTINYAQIIETIKQVNEIPSKLIENLAWRINERLRQLYPQIHHLTVTVTKPSPPIPSTEIQSVSFTLST